jgi:hypothetical protein
MMSQGTSRDAEMPCWMWETGQKPAGPFHDGRLIILMILALSLGTALWLALALFSTP